MSCVHGGSCLCPKTFIVKTYVEDIQPDYVENITYFASKKYHYSVSECTIFHFILHRQNAVPMCGGNKSILNTAVMMEKRFRI